MPTRTSARASGWPTTSSATARPRSRPTSDATCIRRRTTAATWRANPAARAVTLASRPWTDANGNYVVDCDLLNAAVRTCARPAATCAVRATANYGKNRVGHRARPVDPQWLGRARPYDWQFGVSVQQEVMPRVSVEVGYYRRWWPIYDGVDVTDNIAVASSEFGQFSVVAPTDPRLPNGGGYTINGSLQHHAGRGGARRGATCARRPTRTATTTATGTAST